MLKTKIIGATTAVIVALGLSGFPIANNLIDYNVTIVASADIINSGSCGENVHWKLESDGLLTISGIGKMNDDGLPPWYSYRSNIKNVIIEYGVTNIGASAFQNCENLMTVSVPNSVTNISYASFQNCKSLKALTLPNSVKFISGEVFYGCESLESINLPYGIDSIGYIAFNNCQSLKNLIIPDSVKKIALGAFSSCKSMTNVVIPEGVTEIADAAFGQCDNLKSVTVSKSVTSIGNSNFGLIYNYETQSNEKLPGFILYCYKDTAGHRYAIENGLDYVLLDDVSEKVIHNGHDYQLFNEGLTWTEAKQKCEQIGGHLVTITSNDEQEFVNSLMRDKGTKNNYWCGAYRSGDSWAWVSGENFGYTNWAPNEPNNWNGKNEQYVHMFGVRYTEGSGIKEIGDWNDAANDGAGYVTDFYNLDGFGYICEWDNADATLPSDNSEPNDTASDSKKFTLNGHRYEVIQDFGVTSFQKAEEYCRSVGGYLATIQSQEENDFIYSLITSKGYDSAFFGLTDENVEGTWKWTNGETVIYTNWASGEPNGQNSNEDYAMFYHKFTDGKWNDGSWNGSVSAFVCEWDDDTYSANTPADVVVEENSFKVMFDPTSLSISENGSRQLNLVLNSDDQDVLDVYEGFERFSDGWVLSSSDKSVVTVDENGVIYAAKEGIATITALNPDYCDEYGNRIPVTCRIKVLKPSSYVGWNNNDYVPDSASPAPVNAGREKVSNNVATVSDSASPAPAASLSASPIAATGGEFAENKDYTVAVIAVAFLAVIALGFIAVAGKKRNDR